MGWVRIAGLALLVVGCGGDDQPTKAVGDICYVASDCPDPLVCAYQKCRNQCLSSKDCPSKHHCVGATAPRTGVCLPDEDCKRNSDCNQPLVCGRSNLCEQQCQKTVDCLVSQACDRGSCVDVENVPEGGMPPPGTEGQTCLLNSDCAQDLVCYPSGFCGKQCVEDRDCPSGLRCSSHLCVGPGAPSDAGVDAPPGYGKPCAYPSECDAPLICRSTGICAYECVAAGDCKLGETCNAAHNCVVPPLDGGTTDTSTGDSGTGKACTSSSDCDDGVYCNGFERCVGGKCAPPLEGPCDSKSSCVKDACDEATKKCTHTVVTTIDSDGDGHASVACGGDDCNDKDGTIYKGAPELCDLKDNDCDGKIDNDAVQARGPASEVSFATTRTDMLVTTLGTKFVAITSDTTTAYARTVDLAGVAGTEVTLLGGKTKMAILAVATAGDLLALVIDAADSDLLQRRRVLLIKPDLTVLKEVVLSAGYNDTTSRDGAVAWNGTRFIVAWTYGYGYISGQYTAVDRDGSLVGGIRFLPTYGDAKLSAVVVQAAALGATTAIGYRGPVSWGMATVGVSGDKLTDPTTIGPYSADATASNATEFITLAPGTGVVATPMTPSGTLGTTVTLPFTSPLDIVGVGSGYAITGRSWIDYTFRFGYSATGLGGTFDYNSPFPVTVGTTEVVRVGALAGPQFGVFYLATGGDKKLHYQRVGCAP